MAQPYIYVASGSSYIFYTCSHSIHFNYKVQLKHYMLLQRTNLIQARCECVLSLYRHTYYHDALMCMYIRYGDSHNINVATALKRHSLKSMVLMV